MSTLALLVVVFYVITFEVILKNHLYQSVKNIVKNKTKKIFLNRCLTILNFIKYDLLFVFVNVVLYSIFFSFKYLTNVYNRFVF